MMVNDEMLAMAAVLNDCQDLEPGDLVWAKLTGIFYTFLILLHCHMAIIGIATLSLMTLNEDLLNILVLLLSFYEKIIKEISFEVLDFHTLMR